MLQALAATRLILVEGDPGIPSGMIHDPFAGLSQSLIEGKAIGTALMKANVGDRDLRLRGLAATEVQAAIRSASRNSPRSLNRAYAEHREGIRSIVDEFVRGDITKTDARKQSSLMFRKSYERVREIGRRASGLDTLHGESTLYREEEKWFRSAVREEIGYFHGLLEDIGDNRAPRLLDRLEAYTKSLRFMYEAARIQAMPDRALFYWRGPRKADDPKVCEGCEYMMERSPFPKDSIPSVPRDGSTPCLTNCRHYIFVRIAEDLNDVVRRRQALGKRESMVKRLNEMKRAAGLGRQSPHTTAAERNPFKGSPLTKARAPFRRRPL
jgi:hypothetical protein